MNNCFVPLNRVTITGFLTHDPQVKYANDGMPCCDFQIGFRASFVSKGEHKKRDGFVQIATLGCLAEAAGRLRKGLPVCVVGSLREDRWFAGGRRCSKVKVLADELWPMSDETLDERLEREAQESPDAS